MASDNPFCICVAGPNGSGKSTLARGLRRRAEIRWIDPGEIADQVARDQRAASITLAVWQEAFRLSRIRRIQIASRLYDFGFETVFSHGSNLAFVRALKAIGYTTHLYFVATEKPEINIERVINNAKLRGQYVAEQKVHDRYWRSLALLSLAIRDFDRVFLLDNSRRAELSTLTIAGRTVAEFYHDRGGVRNEELQLWPPVPSWVLMYATFPYNTLWHEAPSARSHAAMFGTDVDYVGNPPDSNASLDEHARFFSQFDPQYIPRIQY